MVETIDEAVAMADALLALLAGLESAGADPVALLGAPDIADAIQRCDTPALFRILMDGFSFQGIADAAARAFIARHGNADWRTIERQLTGDTATCSKLDGFAAYRGCGFRKSTLSCANPGALTSCPVPNLPLRKGVLNETAFSLFFLLRDRCGSDLIGFIDQTLAIAVELPDWLTVGREALIAAFIGVAGVSRKLASMMLATLLTSAGPDRPLWIAVGRSMVAIDSLVHNFLHRTGVLAAYEAQHLYGLQCFAPCGCEAIIRDLAERLSQASTKFGAAYVSPRELQHAIWRFCAADELAVCNGNNIRDTAACELASCPLWDRCGRVPLRSPKPVEAS